MARIVFTALGSLGDLFPMFPIAQELKGRGHDIVFAVQSNLAPAVSAAGLEVSSIVIPSFPGASSDRSVAAVRSRINERFPPLLEGALRSLDEACKDADLLVTHQLQVAAAITAQRNGLRWATLAMFPGFIPSAYTVPQPHWLPALPTPLGRLINRATWTTFEFGLRHLTGDVIDSALESRGIAPDHRLFAPGGLSPYLALVLSSAVYSPPQPDWPAQVKVVGYAPWDEPGGWTPPAGMEAFLSSGEAPVLVTTSSAGERDNARFFRMAIDALAAAKKRGVLLVGGGTRVEIPTPGGTAEVVAWSYVPLSRIVPRCQAVVHHAGIGTTLATIRHGRPAVAIPATFDQWYNAGRVRSLGVGRVIKYPALSTERLASEIARVTSDARYRKAAEGLGRRMEREDGRTAAADALEGLLVPTRP